MYVRMSQAIRWDKSENGRREEDLSLTLSLLSLFDIFPLLLQLLFLYR